MSLLLGMLAGFGVVAGGTALVWLIRRRRATTLDDPSILLAEPPPGMTPAVAAFVDGAPTHVSFTAALLDLASRDAIAFVEEGRSGDRADVGIAIRGDDTPEAHGLRPRTRPVGEAETWLLARLTETAEHPARPVWSQDDPTGMLELPFMLINGVQMLAAATAKPPADGSAAPDVPALPRMLTIEPDSDAPAPEAAVAVAPAVAADASAATASQAPAPAPAAAPLAPASAPSAPPAPASAPSASSSAPSASSSPPAASSGPSGAPRRRLYIPARTAHALPIPTLFGTFVETYARRHGWLGSLPIVTRIRWRIAGGVAVALGIAVVTAGVDAYSDRVTGFGTGMLFGGLAVFAAAPRMVQPTREGGRIRAQLAAYRRTLQATFAAAASIDDAVGPGGMRWMETPDDVIVWAVALRIGADVAALLARTPATASAAPAWYHATPAASPAGRRTAHASPAAMFAGIEAIGSAALTGPARAALRPFGWP